MSNPKKTQEVSTNNLNFFFAFARNFSESFHLITKSFLTHAKNHFLYFVQISKFEVNWIFEGVNVL